MNFIGNNQKVNGNGYNIIGNNATVRGNGCTVVGNNANVYGDNNRITGNNAQVWGHGNHVTGNNGRVKSGNNNTLTGFNCGIEGGGSGNTIEGVYESEGVTSFSVGPSGVQIATGMVSGGMFQSSSRNGAIAFGPSKKKKKDKASKKRERDETQYVEGPPPSDLTHDKIVEGEDAKTCIICLERGPCCVAYPCMHAVYCVECARRLCFGASGTELVERGGVECVECRKPVESIKRIFI